MHSHMGVIGLFFLHVYGANKMYVCDVFPTDIGNFGFMNELNDDVSFYTTCHPLGKAPESVGGKEVLGVYTWLVE